MSIFQLDKIFVYPVKSLGGFSVEQWDIDQKGLKYDRKWMLVDEQLNFLSQRKLPKMALIKAAIEGKQLILSTENAQIRFPLHTTGGESLYVTVWHDQCLAETVDASVDEWLSAFLQTPCRLVFLPDDRIRQVDQRYALPYDQTAFSDGFPFLIVSHSSLHALNQIAQTDIEMIRFRPNLVIGGCEPYAEDTWREISINSITFRLPKPCSRCAVPAINPSTAAKEKQPLMALNATRKWEKQVYFGQNALHNSSGTIIQGEAITIRQTGPAQPPL